MDNSLGPGPSKSGSSTSGMSLKRKLTEIPDTDSPVTLRVQFFLVGQGAQEFASSVVHSDLAESYHGQKISTADTSAASVTSEGQKDRFLLFCPRIDKTEVSELARIELTVVSGFGDSLPLSRQQNENMHIILLLYGGPRGDGPTDMGELKMEFVRRLAECRFVPKSARPPLTLLMVNASETAQQEMKDVMEQQRNMDEPLFVATKTLEGTAEDDMIEVLQQICKDTVMFKTGGRYTINLQEAKGGACCSMM